MCKILLLTLLLLMLIGLINKKVLRFIAICVVLVLLSREAVRLYQTGFSMPDCNIGSSVCQIVERFVHSVQKHSEKKTFTVPATKKSALDLFSRAGVVKIHTGDKDEIKVVAEKRAKRKEDLSRVEVLVSQEDDNRIMIKDAPVADEKNINVSVHYDITVPRQLESLLVEAKFGNVMVAGLHAKSKIKTNAGNVQVSFVTGDLEVKANAGNITAKEITGSVEAQTNSGNIALQKISGDIEAKVNYGNIILKDIVGKIEAKTDAGNIDIIKSESKNGTADVTDKIEAKATVGIVRVKNSSGEVIFQGKEVSRAG